MGDSGQHRRGEKSGQGLESLPCLDWLPLALTLFRLAAGPVFVLVGLASDGATPLLVLLIAGLASDIADGMVARRLGISSLALRTLDTRADIVFYSGAALTAFLRWPGLFAMWRPFLVGYLALFLLRNFVDWYRYRASPAYHMWSGKLWSILLFACLVEALLGVQTAWLLPLAFALYAVNSLEGMAASFLLAEPCRDIPTIWHVPARRKALAAAPYSPS